MRKILTLFTTLLLLGSAASAATHTFTSGTTIYVDFSNVSGGVNFPTHDSEGTNYDANGGGKTRAITFTSNVTWNTTSTFIKTATGGWADVKFTVPSSGQNCAVVASDGKSFTWTTVSEDNYAVYFKNTPGWSNVYVHLYGPTQTFGGNGVGGQLASFNVAMDKIGSTAFYKYEFSSAVKFTKVCFTKEPQYNYENFWGNECSWSDGLDFDNNLVLWIPNTASSSNPNNCTYYNTGTWSVYPPLVPGVAFDALPSEVYLNQSVTFAATSENVENPAYTYYVKQGEGEYAAATNPYTFSTAGSYTVKVEVRENGAGEALDKAEQTVICKKYSLMQNNHEWNNKGSEVAVCTSSNGTTFTATWTCPSAGTYYFYVTTNTAVSTNPENADCDFLCGDQTLADGIASTAWLYGAHSNYNHSYALTAPRAGVYTFTLTTGNPGSFKCDFPVALTAEVNLDALPVTAFLNANLTFSTYVGSLNVVQPEYTFFVKKGDAAYGSAVTSYTFDATGEYTVKAEVREEGAGGAALDDSEKVITIYEPLTLYFVNKEGWSNLHAYAFGDGDIKNAIWAGVEMTATGSTTANHGYDVYSITVEKDRYTTVIFNNGNGGTGNQTGDLTIDNAKPYYYNGEWYATLAECDPLDLSTNIVLVGSFNDWKVTANPFVKATPDATEASTTVSITVYNDYEFKLIDNGNWRGTTAASLTLNKDANTTTIASDVEGNNIGLTPYASGSYVFTLNLSTRLLTVTYPDGEQMPIPKNIYLSSEELNSWAPADNDYKFTVDEDHDVAWFKKVLAAESVYKFKVVYNGLFHGANYDFKYYWCTDVPFSKDDSHEAKLYTFKAGEYTFNYQLSTGQLSIVYPTTDYTPIEISEHQYATLYSATAFDVPNGVEAYVIKDCENSKLSMERICRIPAETGVLLHAPQGTYNFYEGEARWMDAVTGNLLLGSTTNQEIDNEKIHYVLSYDNSGNVGFFWPNETGDGIGKFTNGAGKAYLELSSQSAAIIARRGFPLGTEQAEGIDAVKSGEKAVKFIENGQLFIMRDGKLYNAQGLIVK